MTDIQTPDAAGEGKLRHRFWSELSRSPYVMLELADRPGEAAPMTAQLDHEAHHSIWFFTSRSGQFAAGGAAHGLFVSKDHAVFARFAATLREETSRERLVSLWSSTVQAWFPAGKDDPDLLLLHCELGEASLWTPGEMGWISTVKMLLGQDVRAEAAANHVETRL